MLPEVSKGHSSRSPRVRRRPEGIEQARVADVSRRRFLGSEPPSGGQSVAAIAVIQWLESSRQREDLNLVLNHLVRTRMLGGVGGCPGDRAPIPIHGYAARFRNCC